MIQKEHRIRQRHLREVPMSFSNRKGIYKRIAAVGLIFLITMMSVITGCANQKKDENELFRNFTREVFCKEVTSNTISLHYSLSNPEKFGIKHIPATYGTISSEPEELSSSVENMEAALRAFDYKSLSMENRLTYDVLSDYLDQTRKGVNYLLYDEPLGTVNGIHTQLPVLLEEFQFRKKEDIDTYLELIKTTQEYFTSIEKFEIEKANAGLFMSDRAADEVMEQCRAFYEEQESNNLFTGFVKKLDAFEFTPKEKEQYIEKNAQLLNTYVFPAYRHLETVIQRLKGCGKNDGGLCNFPEGKKYYELIAAQSSCSGRSIKELEELTRKQIQTDYQALETAIVSEKNGKKEPVFLKESDPIIILEELKQKIKETFPELADTKVEVKYVPQEMEKSLSPAFYMIPAIDHTHENVIYVNRAYINDPLTLYTTLAHEGYPGHLYQTVYFAQTNPDPIRSMFHFGGYVEGWATYAEMGSYYLSSLPKNQATILQKNSSIILGLYALTDMGIHYDGWTRDDVFHFLEKYGIAQKNIVDKMYDLIIGCPGNYLKYYIGYLEFLDLKQKYMEKAGKNFSQKKFHKMVLEIGPAPFPIVEKYMWEMCEEEQK